MRPWLLAGFATTSVLAASALVLAHSGPHHQAVTIGKGPRLSVTTAPSSFLDPDRMHSVYLANLTDYGIDRVAVVPSSNPAAAEHWTVLDPPLGRTCPFPYAQRCFDQKYYKRLTVSTCGASYRVVISWVVPDGSRGQAVADSIVADCKDLHGVVITLQ